MTGSDYRVSRYDGAVQLLPYGMRERARKLLRADRETAEEFRLRQGGPPTVLLPEGELSLGGSFVTRKDIEMLVEMATGASVHSSAEQLRGGFITVKGGYRIGVCGSVYLASGKVSGFGAFSSAALRISRELQGISDGIAPGLMRRGGFGSTLIIAPPGAGKTTLLRDIIRRLSDGDGGFSGLRVALADERGEVAAMADGMPQMSVGKRTDVLDSCPKAEAVMMLLRAMNPQVIALDEITAPRDVEAIEQARNCGVALLATAHGSGINDLMERPLYRRLFDERVFENLVIIRRRGADRSYELIRGEDL
ncbi:MAG: stage III sporulation protein AB [Oscillospiraceae bacterium]